MKTTAIYSYLIALVAVALSPALVLGDGYDVGGTDPICWETNTNTTARVQLKKCPTGMSMEYTVILPEKMRAFDEYKTVYRMTMDPTMGVITKKLVGNSTVEVPHANIHSCLQKVGFCSPFVGNTPGLATHTAALAGDLVATTTTPVLLEQSFTSMVKLEAAMYTVIAHGRVFVNKCGAGVTGPNCNFQYDIAAAIRRTVIPQENEIVVPSDVRTGMMGAAGASAGIISIVLGLVLKWRNEKVFRYSQPQFLVLLCVCGIVACIGSLTLGAFDLSDSICQVQPWVTTLPVVVMFSFLVAKTLRIMFILNNKKLKKVTNGPIVVVGYGSLFTSVYVIILIANQLVNTPLAVREYAPKDEINFRMVCAGPYDSIFGQLKQWYSVILLLGGVAVAHLTRNFVALFNESKFIAFAIQAICFLAIVILPTSSAVKSEPGPVFLLLGMGIILSSSVVVLSLMIPKFRLVLSGVDLAVSDKNQGDEALTRRGGAVTTPTGGRVNTDSGVGMVSLLRNGALTHDIKTVLKEVRDKAAAMLNDQAAGLAISEDAVDNLKIEVTSLYQMFAKAGSDKPEYKSVSISSVEDLTLKQRTKSMGSVA